MNIGSPRSLEQTDGAPGIPSPSRLPRLLRHAAVVLGAAAAVAGFNGEAVIAPSAASAAPLPSLDGDGQPHPGRHHKSPSSPALERIFDFNMHNWGEPISSNGCGPTSLADAVSNTLGRRVTPAAVHPVIYHWYSRGGTLNGSPYMDGAAPQVARRFGLHYEKISIYEAPQAVRHGKAVIMLASGGPANPITGASHYFESDQIKMVRGMPRLVIHDPNQAEGRHFDKSLQTPQSLVDRGTQQDVWVLSS